VQVWLHSFLTSALDGGEWSASCTGCFTLGERVPVTLDERKDTLNLRNACYHSVQGPCD